MGGWGAVLPAKFKRSSNPSTASASHLREEYLGLRGQCPNAHYKSSDAMVRLGDEQFRGKSKYVLMGKIDQLRSVRLWVVLLAIGIIIWRVSLPHPEPEPLFQGRPLTLWLEDLDGWQGNTNLAVFAAIRAMGSNAVPELVSISLTPAGGPTEHLIAEKLRAFPALKPLAPGDARVLWGRANVALSILEADAQPALSLLAAQLQSPNSVVRARALAALGFVGGPSEDLLPVLLQYTNDNRAEVRGNLMLALGMIGKRPDLSLPALVNGRLDPDSVVSGNAKFALTYFGGFRFGVPVQPFEASSWSDELQQPPTTTPVELNR